jgi:hypothetical protein
MSKWITRLAWVLLALELALLFPLARVRSSDPSVLLGYIGVVVFSLWIITTWLLLAYRAFFQTWAGWLLCGLTLVLSSYVTQGAIPVASGPLSLLFSLLAVISIWLFGLASALFLWKHDVGLPVFAWSTAAVIWLVFAAWRMHGNLLTLDFAHVGSETDSLPTLWWLYPFQPILMWLLPLALLSFGKHTIAIIRREFAEERPSEAKRG